MNLTSSVLTRVGLPMRAAVVAGAVMVCLPSVAHAQSADDGLSARVEQLEQQIVELQVMIGTLESLAKGRPAGGSYQASSSGGGSADVTQLEIQMRAMSGQLAALSRDVRALQNGSIQDSGSLTNNSFAQPTANTGNDLGGFGSVTVTPEQSQAQTVTRDPIENLLTGDQESKPKKQKKLAAVNAVPPRAAYDKAYGYLLEQDYGAAETAFGDFVGKHPKDRLAGNAQYWLGETHYVRGNYRAAANAFLKGYRTYKKSPKAPDSLLKLAMSLSRLGQKPSACATFEELNRRFPSAPAHVTRRSQAERQRAGC